ncbi:hypothetical protein K402DRAFT_391158 [Aulographum hederae CBS 113979]|uniref:Genetic interactor of prohibitins 3, mitochondrial n=1 Tax=Aulographum hederae CBS 113979 TaxID=1176131 RepID=A0A6G1H714_9PEZI|nr:hypothetical protein K402DRAFT_391158 [Aulographum hederae CBS 113979]
MAAASRQLASTVSHGARTSLLEIPAFLCPFLRHPSIRTLSRDAPLQPARRFHTSSRAREEAKEASLQPSEDSNIASDIYHSRKPSLPISCPGCGATSQTVESSQAGYYSTVRLDGKSKSKPKSLLKRKQEEVVFRAAMQAKSGLLEQFGFDTSLKNEDERAQETTRKPDAPFCDRCYNLTHHNIGVPIAHPSVQSLEDTIMESPHKINHIYHVLDAADFPMSLVPNLTQRLSLSRLRTQNRRSKSNRYVHGRIADMSFIITRSDLLGPTKEHVNKLLPYFQDVLREALGRTGHNVRLGNVSLVSSKRGWWNTAVKKQIWDDGGANWLVGKVNVGKSNLFEVIFPKGRKDINIGKVREGVRKRDYERALASNPFNETKIIAPASKRLAAEEELAEEDLAEETQSQEDENDGFQDDVEFDEYSLLPPAQIETNYPVMPIVSALPGTTASPIRIPFGGGRGELIDLPGLARGNLETHVLPEHRKELIMKGRLAPERESVKPGQSVLFGGGLIRITPTTPDLVFLVHSFVPLASHITTTEKAISVQTGKRQSGIQSIVEPASMAKMASASKIQLKWDVTKKHLGSTMKTHSGREIKVEELPFTIYSADILIEGCGWVELVAQVRKKKKEIVVVGAETDQRPGHVIFDNLPDEESSFDKSEEETGNIIPEVEVFSPEGKFVSSRRPMSAWLFNRPKPVSANKRNARPRRSMKSVKAQRAPQKH